MALRRILHVDMDAFYASVEQRDDPSAARQARWSVGGASASAASSPRPATRRARSASARRCRCPRRPAVPDLVFVRPDMSTSTARVSQQVFAIFRAVTPLVEPLSLDEAYLDVTENAWDEPLGVNVARRIKQRIREETRLTASAGVAPEQVPREDRLGLEEARRADGHRPGAHRDFLQGLPVDALWGVGPKTAARLRAARHRAAGRRADARHEAALRAIVGSLAGWLRDAGLGSTSAASSRNARRKSSGRSALTRKT